MSEALPPMPRELMESCLAVSQEATFTGFADSVLKDQITRLHETVYRMGFESGWRIREEYAQQAASAAVLQERERAQNVCLAQYDRNKQSMEVGGMSDNYMTGYHDATGDCAAAIRTAPKESA